MSTIFREIFCGHFPWKLKDENLRKISPKFRRICRRSLAKISQELRSGGLRAQAPPCKMIKAATTPEGYFSTKAVRSSSIWPRRLEQDIGQCVHLLRL